jgi:hypothetical protein
MDLAREAKDLGRVLVVDTRCLLDLFRCSFSNTASVTEKLWTHYSQRPKGKVGIDDLLVLTRRKDYANMAMEITIELDAQFASHLRRCLRPLLAI